MAMATGLRWHFPALALAAGLLLAGAPALQAQGQTKTLEGVISDVMCGATHKMAGKSDKECTLGCVKMGSKYALVVGGTVYELDGHAEDLEKLAGAKAKVTGTVDGRKVQVSAVAKG